MKKRFLLAGIAAVVLLLGSCKKDSDQAGSLRNEVIRRTTAPLLVGERIEFAYGAGSLNGKLQSMQVVASIPGATGTGFETVTHRTVSAADLTTVVGANAVTNAGTSSVTITDTIATTLRYYYVIPEAARGRAVSFVFSVTNRSGNTASTVPAPCSISKMDMARNIALSGTANGARYFSIADMKAYTQAQVDSGNLSARIDFVYAYAATVTPTITAYAYGHALMAPGAPVAYFPAGFSMPAGWTKNITLMEKKIGTTLYDGQLKNDPNVSIYVDDLDMQQQSFAGSASYALGLAADGSVFMKTADGKYTAFVYVNAATNASSSAVISLKRYQN